MAMKCCIATCSPLPACREATDARGSSISNTFVNRCFAVDVARLAGAMIGIRLRGLERDMRLAILSIGKTAAANLPRLVGCVPAFLDASPIGFCFLDVAWNQVF